MATEEVEHKGTTFRRYPDADDWATRNYYRPPGNKIADGVEALHREIYKNEHGDIPDGHAIHHKDGDTSNNDPSNLEAIPIEEHARKHGAPDYDPERLDAARELAKEWHRSGEGREWHREHYKDTLAKAFDEVEKECERCGDTFIDESPHDVGKYCSNACKAAARRERGDDLEERECAYCGDTFEANKHKDTETCSRSCGMSLSWERRS